jgi:hypothetical protein
LANFITDVNRPGLLQIPAGVWTVDAYLSETGGGANHAEIWIEVEKWDGSTITTIATSPIEQITNGNVIDLYTWGVSIPTTTLAVTDRIIIQFYISNTNGKTVTLYTQNGYVGEVHTTFTTGIGSLNGLTAPTQYFATGTSGTDFAISSSTATHTFNLPTASGSNRGALSSADWTTFNSKVGGSGTTNYVSKFTGSGTIGNSQIFDNGTNVGIGTTSVSNVASERVLQLNALSFSTFRLRNDANTVTTILSNNASGWGYVGTETNHPFLFTTNNTEKARLTAAGRLLLGTTTESTFLLDVNGTTRLNGNVTIGASTLILSNQEANQILRITAPLGIQISSDKWISITSSSSYIQNGFTTKNFVSTTQSNGTFNSFDFSNSNSYTPTIAVNYNQKLINGAMTINSTAIANFFGVDSRTTDNSASIANNVYAVYADATLGTNTSANRWAGFFVGRISNTLGATFATSSGNVLIGTTTDAGYKLDVNGTARVSNIFTAGNNIQLSWADTKVSWLFDASYEAGMRMTIATRTLDIFSKSGDGNDEITFSTGATPTEKMRITNGGNVGIGTISPTFLLDVNGTARIGAALTISGATTFANSVWNTSTDGRERLYFTTNSITYLKGDGVIIRNNSNTDVLTATSTGNVGIGTTSPNASALLDVSSTTKGFLPPRMTNAQMVAIATPAAGLVVYDTTNNKLNVYDGTNWVAVH